MFKMDKTTSEIANAPSEQYDSSLIRLQNICFLNSI